MGDGQRRAPQLVFGTFSALAFFAAYANGADDSSCTTPPVSARASPPPQENPLSTGPVPMVVMVATDSARANALQSQAINLLGDHGTLISETDRASCWITRQRCFVNVPGGVASQTLISVARQLGMRAFIRSGWARTLKTPPVMGCYSVASVLSEMLSGAGVQGSFELTDDVVTVTPGPKGDLPYFDIPAGDATKTLHSWGRQGDVQVLYTYPMMGVTTAPLHGFFHPAQALQAMFAGTKPPLMMHWVNDHAVAVLLGEREPWWKRWWNSRVRPVKQPIGDIAEIVIASDQASTSSYTTGAPLITVPKADIDSSGLTTVPDLTRTLPQVWGGGPTDHTQLGREAQTNYSFGTGFNLRGLDAGATLVMVDGHRLAGSGLSAEYVDITNIPLSAIDHIDIVADGASITHGADAVAGTVNFVTRKDFEGLEVEANGARAAGEVRDQSRFSGIFGKHWGGGRAMVALEFDQQAALPAASRSLATNNLVPFGGDNFDLPYGYPGTLVVGSQLWAIPNLHGQPITASVLQAGAENLYDQRLGTDVLPSQRRLSLVTSFSQSLGDHADLWLDSWFSVRDGTAAGTAGLSKILSVPSNNPYYINPTGGNGLVEVLYGFGPALGPLTSRVRLHSGSAALGTQFDTGSWRLGVSAGYAFENGSGLVENSVNQATLSDALASSNPATAFDPFGSSTSSAVLQQIRATYSYRSASAVETLNVTADRPLIHGPAGTAMLLTGAQYRRETFNTDRGPDYSNSIPGYPADYSRDVAAGFGELRVPVIGDRNSREWMRRLEFSLGVRYENYRTFGGSFAPKLGVLWSPTSQVTIRGTWGKAFRPPAMTDLDESRNLSAVTVLQTPSSARGVPVLVWQGGNAALNLQRSTSWTLGADFRPVADLSLGITYFDITDRGRVDKLLLTHNTLTDPTFLGAITWNPTINQRMELCEHSTFYGPGGGCLSLPIEALIDIRAQNLDTLKTHGLDISADSQLESSLGGFECGITATYLMRFSQARGPGAPLLNLLDIEHEPIDWRARGKVAWSWKPLTTTAFVNFTDSYRDIASVPSRPVSSWITFDLDLEYAPGSLGPAWLRGTKFGLAVQNLLDVQAPFLNNSAVGIGYDQENATLVGRVLGFRIRQTW